VTDWTDPETFGVALDRAETLAKGNHFEAFAEGETIRHEPGLVLSAHGNELWMGQTLNHQPAYWRPDAARELGYGRPPIHPDYLLACVLGASVEDLSEKGGYFLGRDDVTLHESEVYPGTSLRVESTVETTRESSSRPEFGIVTWRTEGYDADSGDLLCSYRRTNMLPREEPLAGDGGESPSPASEEGDGPDSDPELPEGEFVAPNGPYFEDFRTALDRAVDVGGTVAYRHERGRTMDDVTVAALPLATLNTARQHHNADAMADSPSGEIVAYGDVTRSVVLAHARSDERTYREESYDDERFHDFVTVGDTVYGFTRVLDAESGDVAGTGRVTFRHYGFDQHGTPVYSGTRTTLVESRERRE
jgi:2-methylfumaryl-CoA hydratase